MAQRASRIESYASTLIPKPALLRKRLEMTGKDITLGKYAVVCLGITLFVDPACRDEAARRSCSALFLGLFVGIGMPHFIIGKMIKRRVNKFNVELPRRDRADGARPALGPSDHRNARHRRQRNSGPGRARVPHGRRQDEDRPHDGSRAAGNRGPPRHARVPVLRHHPGDPARDRRQPRRDAVEPRRRAAQARPDEAQDPRDELGIEGVGLYRRLAAVHRVRARVDDQPGIHGAASSPTSG